MKTVYKYPIGLHISRVNIYKNAQIISAGYDPIGELCIWALVDTEQEKEFVTILAIGTGWELPENGLEFIDKTGACFKYGFGKSISKEPVSEKQFVFALASWEREVCKRLTLFKELEGSTYDFACPTLETDIHKLLYEYVLKN